MANPQTENGFTKIADDILDAFCRFRMPGEVRQVVDCVIRKTYGYKKTEDWIANSQLVEMTGLKKSNVSRALSKAITNNIVIKKDNKLSLNKDYDLWVSFQKVIKNDNKKKLSKRITTVIKVESGVIKKDNHSYQKRGTQKKIITKDNITIERTPSQKMKDFIDATIVRNDDYNLLVGWLKQRGVKEDIAHQELTKFVSYWTELNKSGTKQRWELEKTFEVQKRLTTWFSRIKDFNKEKKGIEL